MGLPNLPPSWVVVACFLPLAWQRAVELGVAVGSIADYTAPLAWGSLYQRVQRCLLQHFFAKNTTPMQNQRWKREISSKLALSALKSSEMEQNPRHR
jgi:hypothetical protein